MPSRSATLRRARAGGLVWMLALLLLLPDAGCRAADRDRPPRTAAAGDATVLRIGAVWSLTGPAAAYGISQRHGADLAVDHVNASGVLGARRLVLDVEDDRSRPDGAVAAFRTLIETARVPAILGPTLSISAAAADPLAQKHGVLVLAVSNTAPGIVEVGDFIFRSALPESRVQPHTIAVTHERIGYRTAALLWGEDDAFTRAGRDVFAAALATHGVRVVAEERFAKGERRFRAQLGRILDAAPEALVVSALAEEAGRIVKEARAAGLPATVPIIGGNGFNSPRVVALAGPAAEGVISGAAWFAGDAAPGNRAFVDAYARRFGSPPDQFAAQAYAGVQILATALQRAGSAEPAALRDAMSRLVYLDSVLGSFSFSPGREAVYTPVVQVVRVGRFALYAD